MRPLYMDAMVSCVFLDKTHVPDGEGGTITTYTEGAAFDAALVLDNSTEAVVAASSGVENIYRVSVHPSVVLEFHDVFRRLSDGQVFRVTSNSDDKKTPERASFRLAVCTAEEWRLPG